MQYRPRHQSLQLLHHLTTLSHKPTIRQPLAVVFCCILIAVVLASLPAIARAQEPVPSPAPLLTDQEFTGDGSVRGILLSGTEGLDIEEDMSVTLDAFIDFQPAALYSTTVSADGAFEFTDLALDSGGENPNLVYIVSSFVDDIRYTSPILTLTEDDPSVDTTVTAYGVTEDDSGLNLDRVHWIVDSQPGALIVLQVLEVSNLADRTYTGSKVDGLEAPVTVAFHVPTDAVELGFENGRLGERFHQIGDLVYDTTPVLPGEGTRQIVMQYAVPYEGDQATLEQVFEYPVDMVNLRITDLPGMDVAVEDLESMGSQDIQGLVYHVWESAGPVQAPLTVNFSNLLEAGEADPRATNMSDSAASSMSPTASQPYEPWMAWATGILVALALAAVTVWSWQQGILSGKSETSNLQSQRKELLHRMAHLDDMHALGDVSDGDWRKQRSLLKNQLMELNSDTADEGAIHAEA